MSDDVLNEAISAVVAHYPVVPAETLSPTTRIWHDLKIGGDDFAELIEELHRAFGVSLAGALTDYCPSEGEVIWGRMWWPFRRPKIYREIPISELVRSARVGSSVG